MGIFRDLISNYANSKMREQQQKLQYNQGLGDILTTLIRNPDTDPATLSKASSYYVDLMGQHGGKEGKALQGQISQFLNIYAQKRATDMARQRFGFGPDDQQAPEQGGAPPVQPTPPGGTQPQQGTPATPPFRQQLEPPTPPGQQPGQPGGVNQGWPTANLPTTLAGQGAQGAQPSATAAAAASSTPGAGSVPAQRRGGLGGALRGLAGVGGEMVGIPRGTPPSLPSKELFAPTPTEEAQEKERGVIAAGRLEREEYVRQQKANEAANLQTPEETQENIKEYDRAMKPPAARTAAEEAQTMTTVQLKSTGEIIPAWESKRGQGFMTLSRQPIDPNDIRSVGTPVDPKTSGRLKERIDALKILRDPKSTDIEKEGAKAEISYMDTQAESAASLQQIRARQIEQASSIVPGTAEFQIAQNLAYGLLTFEGLKSLVSYRDTDRREALYYKATQLNPSFNQAEFEAGFRFFARPQTKQQLASMDNVQAAVDDMVRFSDAAKRAGNPFMNQFVLPGGYMMGNRPIANFQLALVAFSDELAGALGQGANTDMTRRMGREMSDGKVDPDTFRSNLQIVQGFLDRKRNSLLGEMSVYGQPGGQIPVMQNREQYDALPSGAKWRKPSDPPGTERTKP